MRSPPKREKGGGGGGRGDEAWPKNSKSINLLWEYFLIKPHCWLGNSQLIHLPDIFEKKLLKQKFRFHANEMMWCHDIMSLSKEPACGVETAILILFPSYMKISIPKGKLTQSKFKQKLIWFICNLVWVYGSVSDDKKWCMKIITTVNPHKLIITCYLPYIIHLCAKYGPVEFIRVGKT